MDTISFEDGVNFLEGKTELFFVSDQENEVLAAVQTYCLREQEISCDKLQAVVDDVDDPNLVAKLVDTD